MDKSTAPTISLQESKNRHLASVNPEAIAVTSISKRLLKRNATATLDNAKVSSYITTESIADGTVCVFIEKAYAKRIAVIKSVCISEKTFTNKNTVETAKHKAATGKNALFSRTLPLFSFKTKYAPMTESKRFTSSSINKLIIIPHA